MRIAPYSKMSEVEQRVVEKIPVTQSATADAPGVKDSTGGQCPILFHYQTLGRVDAGSRLVWPGWRAWSWTIAEFQCDMLFLNCGLLILLYQYDFIRNRHKKLTEQYL